MRHHHFQEIRSKRLSLTHRLAMIPGRGSRIGVFQCHSDGGRYGIDGRHGRDENGNDNLPPSGFLAAVREAVREIFTLAKWPQGTPQKLFEAPVNDEQDLLFVKTKFRKAMEGPDYPVPREMYLPEKLNRDLRFTPQLHDEASGAQSSQQGSTNRYAYYFTTNSTGGAT